MIQTIITRDDFNKLTNLVSSDDVKRSSMAEKASKKKLNNEKLNKWGLTADQIKNRNQEAH
jgi:hypothetical protein